MGTQGVRTCACTCTCATFLTDDFFGFRVELNLYLNEARRKAYNKPINTLSHLIHAGKRLRNLWTIDLATTVWAVLPYDSLPARKVSFHRSGKTLTQHCLSLFPLFWVRVANHLAFGVRRTATWSLSPEWRKTLWPPNTSFSLRLVPRLPRTLTPNLLSPQKHKNSDWVRVCF